MLGQSNVMATMAVSDINKARAFYTKTLGLNVTQEPMEGVLVLGGANNTNIQLYQKDHVTPSQNTCCTFDVSDLDGALTNLGDKGVTFEEYDTPDVQTQGAVATVGTHKAAWFRDPDGNILCLHQETN